MTRQLASPRLAAALLSGGGVEQADVLACFAPNARLAAVGAIRLHAPDPAFPLADRAIKLTDRLAAFLLGAGAGFGEAGAPLPIRRVHADGADPGRGEAVQEVASVVAGTDETPTRRLRAGCSGDRRRRGRQAPSCCSTFAI